LKVARGHPLFSNLAEKDQLEARNARLQFRRVLELVPHVRGEPKDSGHLLRLTPEIIKDLHLSAIQGIYSCAGTFRTWRVGIKSSPHKPPDPEYVPGLVEDMCERANGVGDEWDAVQTAAYLLWRFNWIHPFGGGNGRTSRAVTHLALCVRLGFVPPGSPTIYESIVANRERYIQALREADEAWNAGILDISLMAQFLDEILGEQIGGATETRPET
jgi:Fic family protein